jgi:hypothetical protein
VKSGFVTGVSHCCFGSTGRVAVAVLKASNGPEALVALTVSVPAGREIRMQQHQQRQG